MAERAPQALVSQALAAGRTAAAAKAYFLAPSPLAAGRVLETRLEARRARAAVDAAVEALTGRKSDWLAISAAVADLADEAGWAVEEHERFDAKLGAAGRQLSRTLERASALLCAALGRLDEASDPLAEAKNKALQIEDIRRTARQAALNQPRLASELSAQAVLDRFSRAGEAVHRAADALAARLAGAK